MFVWSKTKFSSETEDFFFARLPSILRKLIYRSFCPDSNVKYFKFSLTTLYPGYQRLFLASVGQRPTQRAACCKKKLFARFTIENISCNRKPLAPHWKANNATAKYCSTAFSWMATLWISSPTIGKDSVANGLQRPTWPALNSVAWNKTRSITTPYSPQPHYSPSPPLPPRLRFGCDANPAQVFPQYLSPAPMYTPWRRDLVE